MCLRQLTCENCPMYLEISPKPTSHNMHCSCTACLELTAVELLNSILPEILDTFWTKFPVAYITPAVSRSTCPGRFYRHAGIKNKLLWDNEYEVDLWRTLSRPWELKKLRSQYGRVRYRIPKPLPRPKPRLLNYTVVLVLDTSGRSTHHLGIRNERDGTTFKSLSYIYICNHTWAPIIFGLPQMEKKHTLNKLCVSYRVVRFLQINELRSDLTPDASRWREHI